MTNIFVVSNWDSTSWAATSECKVSCLQHESHWWHARTADDLVIATIPEGVKTFLGSLSQFIHICLRGIDAGDIRRFAGCKKIPDRCLSTQTFCTGTSRAIVPRWSCLPVLLTSQRILKILFQSKNSWIYFKIAMCGFPFRNGVGFFCNFMATVAGPGIGFEAHSRQGSGGEDSYGIQWFSNVPSQKWTVWAQKIVVLEDELPFEKAQPCRCHVSFRGYGTSFGGRNYHSNRFKWMILFHVSRPTWWPCNKWVVE